MSAFCRRSLITAAACLAASSASAAEDWWSHGYALEIFGGAVTARQTTEILTGTVSFNRGGLIAVAGSKELLELGGGFAIRVQALAARRFQSVDYNEFAVMIGLEYADFPWSNRLPTSIEVSTGPSYATAIPAIERHAGQEASHWLNALAIELSVAASADSPWSFVTRYHHRSGAFGLYPGEQDGSSALTVGVKYKF